MECVKACGPDAIDLQMQEETFDLKIGTIILATGHQFFDPAQLPQYHYGRFANILDSMEFERMCNASGPTGGEILTADGRMPERIVFIHCVGSRDAHTHPYCSRLCCMHAMKQAHLAKERTGAEVYELYIDIRAPGKGYEEFYEQVQREGVIFIRGRGGRGDPDGGQAGGQGRGHEPGPSDHPAGGHGDPGDRHGAARRQRAGGARPSM